MSAEALARIDALRAEITAAVEDYRRIFPEPCALAPNLDLAVRALALIPEPPTADEREALVKSFADAIYAAGLRSPESTKAVIAFKGSLDVWRNRHRGPISGEAIEAAKWAIARERFERAGVDPDKVEQRDADRCEADARAALEAAEVERLA